MFFNINKLVSFLLEEKIFRKRQVVDQTNYIRFVFLWLAYVIEYNKYVGRLKGIERAKRTENKRAG